ncbi:DHH family phosphoesterase [Desulfurispira natronophila]|uniref:Phosphoesterase RecJ-like protein n=1 Tax=Desulfurispira natronophila TaxID=682562 RepID=A0A7W7Y431_9BACT|nr:DHH family phosphoesterase [Desulfurispira natronophila]MBB5021682.1 phosphoesterase RecJ-like protein [Desulfurispira natronophila]
MTKLLFDDRPAIWDILYSAQRPAVVAHLNPDGDTIGCALALFHRLKTMGREPWVVCESPITREYHFLPGAECFRHSIPDEADAIIAVDASTLDRLGDVGWHENVPTVNIDHHITNKGFARYNYVIGEAAATAMLIYELLEKMGPVDYQESLCLYTALFTDTGGFRYSSSSPESHIIAARLLEKGIDPWQITVQIYESMAWEKMLLLRHCLERVEFNRSKGVAWTWVNQQDFQETGTEPSDTDGFINYLRAIDGVEVAVFIRQDSPTSHKVSFRSKGRINVASICDGFGGGGHHNAGGFQVDNLDITSIMEEIYRLLP